MRTPPGKLTARVGPCSPYIRNVSGKNQERILPTTSNSLAWSMVTTTDGLTSRQQQVDEALYKWNLQSKMV